MASAAMVNAAFGHGLDLDDGNRFSNYHPGVCAIPSALAVAEATAATGADMLKAVVAAYEVSIRIGKAINPSHLKRGYHTTGTIGVFGAAVAAARLLHLNPEQTANAIGMAAHGCSGLLQFTMAKPLNPAQAVRQGILCARLAQQGAVGSREIFEGKNGFLSAFADSVRMDAMTRGLGEQFDMLGTSTKMYACCRHIHPPLDVALGICAEEGVKPEDIESIDVQTYSVALQVSNLKLDPKDPPEAKFSIPVSLALGICSGQAGPEVYRMDRIHAPDVRELASRINISVSPEWDRRYADQDRGVTLTIKASGGREFTRSQPLPRGEAEIPLSEEELFKKFMSNAQSLYSSQTCQQLLDTIVQLDRNPVSDVTELLTSTGTA